MTPSQTGQNTVRFSSEVLMASLVATSCTKSVYEVFEVLEQSSTHAPNHSSWFLSHVLFSWSLKMAEWESHNWYLEATVASKPHSNHAQHQHQNPLLKVSSYSTLLSHPSNLFYTNDLVFVAMDFNSPDLNWNTLTGSSHFSHFLVTSGLNTISLSYSLYSHSG